MAKLGEEKEEGRWTWIPSFYLPCPSHGGNIGRNMQDDRSDNYCRSQRGVLPPYRELESNTKVCPQNYFFMALLGRNLAGGGMLHW